MNGEQKPGKTSSKKGVKVLPGIPDINSIFNRSSSTYGILPQQPPPPPPNLPLLGGAVITAPVRAPIDNTDIMVNGRVTNMNEAINTRIEENAFIRPISPPQRPLEQPEYTREPMTPNFGIPSNIKFVSTPPPVIYEKAETINSDGRSVISESVDTPLTKTTIDTRLSESGNSTPSINRKINIKSVLPVFNKPRQSENRPEVNEDTSPLSPVNIPVPVFNVQPRVVSPIQTIGGPQSPARPIFNSSGKSHTPVKISRPPTVRAPSPPPAFRTQYNRAPSPPPKPMSPHRRSGYGETFHSLEGLTREQETYLRQEFKVKFGILRANYPQWGVIDPPDSLTVIQMNELYERYLRQIMVSKETGQYKVYMVIFLMVIEVIGVKFLKLNMSGYTMSQLKIINRYDALFIELGEKWLVSGASSWPIEARLIMMVMFNAVIFLVVRYLCSWLGAEGLADTLQGWIDGMLNGPAVFSGASNVPTGGHIDPMTANGSSVPLGASAPPATDSGNPIDSIANAFGNFFSNNAGNIGEKIAQIGTVFSNKLQNSNKTQPQTSKPVPAVPVNLAGKKINKKKLFED